jgi:hypothetical protein
MTYVKVKTVNFTANTFGQRQNMGATEYVTDVRRFYEILLDEKLDNIRINDINENMLQIDYKLKDCYMYRK